MSPTTDPLADYTAHLVGQLERLADQAKIIEDAAQAIADSIAADGMLHVFGTGHSHLLAAELFYRAGGLGAVNPVLIEGLLLHAGAELSTSMERTAGLGPVIFARMDARPTDTLLVISNSGSNVIARELTQLANDAGMATIALVSVAHATSATSRGSSVAGIHQLARFVIDNGGVPGDAAIEVSGVDRPMGPTSTVMGSAIVNLLAMTAAMKVAQAGAQPAVFTSSNVLDGDGQNQATLERYRSRVRSL
ncbi:sugar isomerase domain-containing protein [Salinibacterium sp. G-O1]|uniref:sugar isomerase domain-containing protein n=1 Tax=Salinibacterium sp. G-O1 TaxID=3046208 RepID=UPI0024B8F0CB|nr:sugar isomerase domain-containing protein [Salinibacterium sp. G-O1]MDJ0335254.1 sugar isomerase domain-containing protein [Salinibacterium sp. G-O1]